MWTEEAKRRSTRAQRRAFSMELLGVDVEEMEEESRQRAKEEREKRDEQRRKERWSRPSFVERVP